jgi:sulfopyruvate decarboxylase subunit beta
VKSFEAIRLVAEQVTADDLVVITSTGVIKDEWHEVMPGDGTLFLPLLGGSLPFGLGMAIGAPHRRVMVLDSDGGMIFDPAALLTVANELPPNLSTVVFDNEMYESIGKPPTHTARNVDLERLADGAGIPFTGTARSTDEMKSMLAEMLTDDLPGVVVAKVDPGAATDLPRDRVKRSDFVEDKYRFLRHLEKLENISLRAPFTPD